MKRFKASQNTKDACLEDFPIVGMGNYSVFYFIIPASLFAMLFHPTLNGFFLTDFAWTFACYLETVALVPQMYLLHQRTEREIDPFTSHWVFSLGLGRFLHFVFWLSSYHELNDSKSFNSSHVGYLVLFAQFLQIIIISDFVYFYVKALVTGKEMELPTPYNGGFEV